MGLIQMISGAVGTTFRDAVKDYYRCDGMTNDVLCIPATQVKRGNAVNNSSDRVITNGSIFDVAVNQAALLIENGKVHDYIIATTNEEAGRYKYDSTVEPSLLGGGLKDFLPTMQTMLDRFTAGGQSTNTMNLVYINLKEITKNPIGLGKLAFLDKRLNHRFYLSAHGYYTFAIKNPVTFYENLVMDVTKKYNKSEIITQLKAEMVPKIQRAMGQISALCQNGFEDIYLHDEDIANIINEELTEEWLEARGIQLLKVSLSPELSDEDKEKLDKLEMAMSLSDSQRALGSLVNAQGEAMVGAANNANGAMQGFLGMGMANGMGGFNTTNLLQQQMQNEQQQRMAQQQSQMGMMGGANKPDSWQCSCGNVATGKFCSNCGSTKPVADGAWQCACGNMAVGKFCNNCGAKKPEVQSGVVCPNCGTKFDDVNTKFCNNCGTKLN